MSERPSLRRIIRSLTPRKVLEWRHRHARKDLAGKAPATVFGSIYEENRWQSTESVSGVGSEMATTAVIRKLLPDLLGREGARRMLDIPCGDFHWMQQVDLSGVHYIGGDIVPQLIQQDQARFARPDREFRVLNLLEDELPKVNLILCRDCLIHLSFEHIRQALQNIKRSGADYLLTNTYPEQVKNYDIPTGSARGVNLLKPPFSFPPPLERHHEEPERHAAGINGADKMIGLWRIADLG